VELDRGLLRSYPGNYAEYERRKSDELAAEDVARRKFDKFWAQEEAWIRRGIEARRTRNEGRVRRLEALRRERASRRERLGNVRLGLDAGDRSGKLVAELRDVAKSFGDIPVVSGLSLRVMRGDRLGLLGPNGAGKSTLIRLLLGELPPDRGTVRLGTGLQVAYFDQLREQLDPEATLAETIAPGSDWVEVAGRRKHVVSYLGDFLFPSERAQAPVRMLSGGERNRLLLARLFARPANLLVLDEPTNDLDIESLELLEATLQDYPGTLLLVSHDRRFLDNVVRRRPLAGIRRRLQRLARTAARAVRRGAPRPARCRDSARPDAGPPRPGPHQAQLQGNPGAGVAAGRDRVAGAGTAGAAVTHGAGRLSRHRGRPDPCRPRPAGRNRTAPRGEVRALGTAGRAQRAVPRLTAGPDPCAR